MNQHYVFEKFLPLVDDVIATFNIDERNYEDVYQEGCIGLLKAISYINVKKRGAENYCKKAIKNAIFHSVFMNNWANSVCPNSRKEDFKIRLYIEEDIEELTKLGYSGDELWEAIKERRDMTQDELDGIMEKTYESHLLPLESAKSEAYSFEGEYLENTQIGYIVSLLEKNPKANKMMSCGKTKLEIFKDYYLNDKNLTEISEEIGITKQFIWSIIQEITQIAKNSLIECGEIVY